jgi:hypothetical protein
VREPAVPPRTIAAITICVLAGLGPGLASGEEAKPGESGTQTAITEAAAQARGRELLERKLATLPGAERGRVVSIREGSLGRVFPGYLFYVLRFRQYPVALNPPAPLRSNSLLIVRPDDAVALLADPEALEGFFRSTLPAATTAAMATEAAKAWLRLVEELNQDGFLQFAVADESITVAPVASGGQRVTGEAVVVPKGGNQGGIRAVLVFDSSGTLVSASETAQIKHGIRPICQATKLLDPDLIVRAMAEQAILVMGRAAKEYLAEQRESASPELRDAIDRIWHKIVSEDR